jgi:hypothetical protein
MTAPEEDIARARIHQRMCPPLRPHPDGRVISEREPDATVLVSFDALLQDPAGTTGRPAEWLGIDPVPSLTHRTFNGMSIRASSSFADASSEKVPA